MTKLSFRHKFHSKLRKDKYKTLRLNYNTSLKLNNTRRRLPFLNKNFYILSLLFLPNNLNSKKITVFSRIKYNNVRLVFKNLQLKKTFVNNSLTSYSTNKLIGSRYWSNSFIDYKNIIYFPIVNHISFIRKHFMFKYKYTHRRTKLHKSYLVYKYNYYNTLHTIKSTIKGYFFKNNLYIPLTTSNFNFIKLFYYNGLFKRFSPTNNCLNSHKKSGVKNLFYKNVSYKIQKGLLNFIKNRFLSKRFKYLNLRNNFKRLRLFRFMMRKLSLTTRRHFIIKFRLTHTKSYMSKFNVFKYINLNCVNKFSNFCSEALRLSNCSGWSNYLKYNNNILSNFILNPNFLPYLLKNNLNPKSPTFDISNSVSITNNIINQKFIPAFFKDNNIIKNNKFKANYIRYFFDLSKESLYKSYLGRWINSTAINFLEHVSGKKVLVQVFPFVESTLSFDFRLLYLRWLPRLIYYARRLGHRFFLREALYIIHTSLHDHDSQLVISWLKAMISRISFWKTRLIFRFIRYVFLNLYQKHLKYIGAKGFKVKLKGKISIAGNGRKKTILFRSGKNSYSTVDLKVLYTYKTINTFTGVQGLQLWVFY